MNTSNLEKEILAIIKNPTLTHEQTMMALAKKAENVLTTPGKPTLYDELNNEGIICDLNEGHAPYAPRYILPNYALLFEKGCEFLRLDPPTNLFEAINTLLIFYKHVPSVTHFPVYIGNIDKLLEPFVDTVSEEQGRMFIKGFLKQIDRTITDSFCHGNIGPEATKVGRYILDAQRELQDSTPNLTLLYDPEVTSDEFAQHCAMTALDCASPSFANHKMFESELGKDYGIASCYNGLPVGGGAFTLTRLMLSRIVKRCANIDEFFAKHLNEAIDTMCSFMDCKIKFLVEETPFFQSNFLVREGFLTQDRFVGLFGVVGLCECVNDLMTLDGKSDKFGYSKAADELGIKIMDCIQARVNEHTNPFCEFWDHRFMLHAQVGTDLDSGISPGTRIAIGDEIPLYDHIRQAGQFHHYFPSGTGDIFPFDSTTVKNPQSLVDVIKGSFQCGMRYFSTYSQDSDVIRITGYLVKKSDIAKLQQGNAVVNDTVVLGMGNVMKSKTYERMVRKLS